ncbi:uncharacterized protein BDV17DRAFT_260442 [Aspergillus undulatus]|uniref:uncharacterized protein n=1 Tax=Aspergillus undulatus TaxID=1810928 RepID=UPI003CCD0A65
MKIVSKNIPSTEIIISWIVLPFISKMKITSLSHALRSLLILSLLSCIFVSALNLKSRQRGLRENVFARNLPGSLASAPEEAVGSYQPPHGPAQSEPSAATAAKNPDPSTTSIASEAVDTDNDKQSLESTESQDDVKSHGHIPSVSEMDAMMMKMVETASASRRNIVRLFASLLASISVSLLFI